MSYRVRHHRSSKQPHILRTVDPQAGMDKRTGLLHKGDKENRLVLMCVVPLAGGSRWRQTMA